MDDLYSLTVCRYEIEPSSRAAEAFGFEYSRCENVTSAEIVKEPTIETFFLQCGLNLGNSSRSFIRRTRRCGRGCCRARARVSLYGLLSPGRGRRRTWRDLS